MYHSIHDVLLPLGDEVHVYPTHGAGSLCSTGIGDRRLGRRSATSAGPTHCSRRWRSRRSRGRCSPASRRSRTTSRGCGRPTRPDRRCSADGSRARRRWGPMPSPPRWPRVRRWSMRGRRRTTSSRHVPGSISIPLEDSFGTWLGWVVDLDRPVVLIVAGPQDLDTLTRQAIRIGRDEIAGYLDGGLRRVGRVRTAGRGERPLVDRGARRGAGRVRVGRGPARHRRPAGERVRGRPRPGRLAHQRRVAAGPSRRPAARPPDRDDLRERLPGGVGTSLLRASGFERAGWVGAGFPAWRDAGLPVETGDGR